MRLTRFIDRSPRITVALFTFCATLIVLVAWRAGAFEFLELELLDYRIRRDKHSEELSHRITIVGIHDNDVRLYGTVIDDLVLAELLQKLAEAGPRTIGVDIYRDLPEPRSAEKTPILNRTLQQAGNVVCIYSVDAKTPPPPAIADQRERIGFNDFPVNDPEKMVVRRALISMTDTAQQQVASFAFQLAVSYLKPDGIVPANDPKHPEWIRLGKTAFRPFEPNDGMYINADAHGYQFILDYKGPAQFPVYSLEQALTGKIPRQDLHNRVVLIGRTAKQLKDFLNTPLKAEQFGVEVHARALDQLLRAALAGEKQVRSWPESLEGIWIALFCAVGAVIGYYTRSPLVLIGFLAGSIALVFTGAGALFNENWWIPTIAPATGSFLSTALVTSYRSYQERQQRTILMQLFSRHVSRSIAESIWKQRELFLDGGRPRSQKLTATVLFTDLKGFSSISERVDPAVLTQWLNEYLDQMSRVVAQHGGVVNKFIGDAVMAIFGVPVPRLSHDEIRSDAVHALRSALLMREVLAGLNAQWAAAGAPTVSMRIGIFTGSVIAGTVGSSDRLEYTVVGDTVNTASRLESYDKEVCDPDQQEGRCRILVGQSTISLVDEQFETRLVGTINVKGKLEKVTVYQLIREKAPI
jgi:adenylate cyclase